MAELSNKISVDYAGLIHTDIIEKSIRMDKSDEPVATKTNIDQYITHFALLNGTEIERERFSWQPN